MSWEEINLGDAIHIKHGFAFESRYFEENGEHIVLTPGNFDEKGGFRVRPEKDRAYVGDIPDGYILAEGDLIVAMTEQSPGLLGSSALIPESNRFLHNQRLGLIDEIDQKRFDKRFLYYLFNTYSVRGQISGSASGTKVRHTSPERIYRVRVRVPDIPTQRKIAETLSCYDDLIENNRRRIELLEDAALQLYREWFVRLRFPGHEHTCITDGVPEGWERGCVADFGEVLTGKTPSTKESDNYGGDIPFIKTPDMHGKVLITNTEAYLTERGAETQPRKFIPSNSILVSCIGTIGVVSITTERSQFNQQINAVVPVEDMYRYYCFFAFRDLRPEMEAIGGGSTMGNVNKTKFENLKVLKPACQLLREFHEFSLPLFRQIHILSIQNEKFIEARDLLLPKLMSGEMAA